VAVAVAPLEPDVGVERAATDAIDGSDDEEDQKKDQDEDDEKSDAIADPEDVVDVDAKTPMVEITNDAEPVMRGDALFEKNAGEDDEAADAVDELTEHIAEVKVAPAPNGKKKKKNRGGRK
jgi:hypothetical protein